MKIRSVAFKSMCILYLCIGRTEVAWGNQSNGQFITLRVRLSNGSLKKIGLSKSSTIGDLKQKLLAEGCMYSPDDELILEDVKIQGEDSTTFEEASIKNGDIINLNYKSKEGQDSKPTSSHTLISKHTEKEHQQVPRNSAFDERVQRKRKSSLPHGATSFVPFPELARKRNVEMSRGKQGFSWHDIEVEEGSKFRVKRQEKANIEKVSVGRQCAESLITFLKETGFKKMRCGLLLGHRINSTNQVMADVIWEPLQHPTEEGEYDPHQLSLDQTKSSTVSEALTVARWLGLEPVGWVFSCRKRDYEFSALDVVTAAKLELKAMQLFGSDVGKRFAIVVAKCPGSSDEEVQFEAFQISDLAVQMEAEGVLMDDIAHSSDKVQTTENVLSENRNTREIDCLWFAVPVPIVTHESKLHANFPIPQRTGRQTLQKDLKAALFNSKVSQAHVPLEDRLADFSLLLQLYKKFENPDDFKELCGCLHIKKKRTRISSKIKLLLEMICDSSSSSA